MGHFAEIDKNGLVIRVVVANQEYIDTGSLGDPLTWVQTSYNTRGGVHYLPNSNTPSGNLQFRKNYAGIGYMYDKKRDAFIPPKPFDSWILNEDTCLWDPPVPFPETEEFLQWNEKTKQWEIPKKLDEQTGEWVFE